jgi:hypothetical protein
MTPRGRVSLDASPAYREYGRRWQDGLTYLGSRARRAA